MSVSELRAVFIADGLGIFLMLLLRYASRTRILRQRAEDKLYTFMVYGVLLGCFLDAFSFAIDGKLFPGARELNYAANTYLYTFNMLLPLGLVFFIDLELYKDPARLWKGYKVQIIVAAVMVLLNVLNFFTPIIYELSPENVYSRRPLSYSFYAAIMFFFISALIVSLRYEREFGTRSFVNIYVFLLPVAFGIGLQFLFYGLPLAWLASAVGLVGLYMMQQNEMAYVDPLVETYNRQYLTYVLSSWVGKGRHFVGAMLDIDRFKQINDAYGHAEGDRALKTVAEILKASRRENEWVFRFAGDEFIILRLTESEDGLEDYLREVERRLEEFNREPPLYVISLSSGTSFCDSKNLDRFLNEMDVNLYEMKANHHDAEARAPAGAAPQG